MRSLALSAASKIDDAFMLQLPTCAEFCRPKLGRIPRSCAICRCGDRKSVRYVASRNCIRTRCVFSFCRPFAILFLAPRWWSIGQSVDLESVGLFSLFLADTERHVSDIGAIPAHDTTSPSSGAESINELSAEGAGTDFSFFSSTLFRRCQVFPSSFLCSNDNRADSFAA